MPHIDCTVLYRCSKSYICNDVPRPVFQLSAVVQKDTPAITVSENSKPFVFLMLSIRHFEIFSWFFFFVVFFFFFFFFFLFFAFFVSFLLLFCFLKLETICMKCQILFSEKK